MQPKKMSSLIIAKRKDAASPIESMQPDGEVAPQLSAAAEKLVSAVHAKDSAAVANALQEAFQHLDAQEAKDEKSE